MRFSKADTFYDSEFELELEEDVSIRIVQRKHKIEYHGFYCSKSFNNAICFRKEKPIRKMIEILKEFRKYE